MLTIAEVAEILAVDVEDARGLVRFLRAKDIVVSRGIRKARFGHGEGVFDFPADVSKQVASLLKPLGGK